jgi:tRNA threonylcarbamoyladenosine biosynthesis protein TsaE
VEDTARLAEALAGQLTAGDSVWLRGELGAGKTAFVRAAAAALGFEGAVTSPTYTVGNRYQGSGPDVSHLDLYRSSGLTEEEWGDLEPYFDGSIAFVEWPEHGGDWLPKARATVTLNHVDESHRRVRIDSDLGL